MKSLDLLLRLSDSSFIIVNATFLNPADLLPNRSGVWMQGEVCVCGSFMAKVW